MPDIGETANPIIEPLLEPGETLAGVCVGSRASLISGKFVTIGVTDRRLIIQETTRKQEPKGEPLSLTPAEIAKAKVGGAGGWGGDPQSAIMNKTSLTIKIKTTAGESVKLMVGKATGPLTKLMGGETQAQGVKAVTEWLERAG